MSDIFAHLNGSDARLDPAEDEVQAELPRRRVLGRLGEYVAAVVKPLNMRPTSATLLFENADRVEVRVSTSAAHVVLVIAPEGDLAADLFFIRSLSGKRLPVPSLIAADLSCAYVPFSYILHSYVPGVPLSALTDPVRIRMAGRQIGRMLRRAHNTPAPGFGKPTMAGRWSTRGWDSVLAEWLSRRGCQSHAVDALGEEMTAQLWAETVEHEALRCDQASLLHGAVEPARALVTTGDAVQLEGLLRPGDLVGGDPFFDLAYSLLPRHPIAFQQGVFEGYTASGELSPEQHDRLRRLRLLLHVADTLTSGDETAVARLPDILASSLGQVIQQSS